MVRDSIFRRLSQVFWMLVGVVGLAGIPDDIKKWSEWFKLVDSETARWLFVLSAIGVLLGSRVHLRAGFGLSKVAPRLEGQSTRVLIGPVMPADRGPGLRGLGSLERLTLGCVVLLIVTGIFVGAGAAFVGTKFNVLARGFVEGPVERGGKAYALIDPDVKFVSANEKNRTVLFRHEKTGEEMTFNFDDVQNGKIAFHTWDGEGGEGKVSVKNDGDGGLTVQSSEGTAIFGGTRGAEDLPKWIPVYEGADVQIGFSTSGDQGAAGAFSLKSKASPKEVLDYYEKTLKDSGYEVKRETVGSEARGLVTGRHMESDRTLWVSATLGGNMTEAVVQYSAKE